MAEFLRVVTAYRPCHICGVKSTVTQQFRQLGKEQRGIHPRHTFMDDLASEIKG